MPFVSIPTVSPGEVLSAEYLNLLGSNQEFLYGLVNAPVIPFNSYRASHTNFNAGHMIWYVRHRLRYLNWRVSQLDSSGADYVRIYYDSILIGGSESPGPVTAGYYDTALWPTTLPLYRGEWASGISYNFDANGGNDIVYRAGMFYQTKVDHTSSATSEPQVGATWTDYWSVLNQLSIGQIYPWHVEIVRSPIDQITVEYLIESDTPL